MNPTSSFAESVADGLFVNRNANSFHERAHCAWRIRVSQEHAMHARSEHLLEHPRVGTHCGFVYSINRHIDNNCGSAMTAFGRTTGCQSLHILGETFDVIWCMFHVIADVVRIGLSIFLSLLEITLRAGM